jgi:hypothetical protein
MNLEQYVTDLCGKLRSCEAVAIDASFMAYRHLMAGVLQNHLTGPASSVIDGLLGQVVQMQMQVDRDNAARARAARANVACASLAEAEVKAPVSGKPKRVIQDAPNAGSIPKDKIEKAVKTSVFGGAKQAPSKAE